MLTRFVKTPDTSRDPSASRRTYPFDRILAMQMIDILIQGYMAYLHCLNKALYTYERTYYQVSKSNSWCFVLKPSSRGINIPNQARYRSLSSLSPPNNCSNLQVILFKTLNTQRHITKLTSFYCFKDIPNSYNLLIDLISIKVILNSRCPPYWDIKLGRNIRLIWLNKYVVLLYSNNIIVYQNTLNKCFY